MFRREKNMPSLNAHKKLPSMGMTLAQGLIGTSSHRTQITSAAVVRLNLRIPCEQLVAKKSGLTSSSEWKELRMSLSNQGRNWLSLSSMRSSSQEKGGSYANGVVSMGGSSDDTGWPSVCGRVLCGEQLCLLARPARPAAAGVGPGCHPRTAYQRFSCATDHWTPGDDPWIGDVLSGGGTHRGHPSFSPSRAH